MNKSDTAYAQLKERIADGHYSPGSRLVIDQLARENGTSAIPWREAIRRLEAEGWIEMVPNVGPRVATFDFGAYAQSVQVLARLEGYATAAAAELMGPDDIDALRAINGQMGQAREDFDPVRFGELNRQFHFFMYERCGNPHLYKLILNEWQRLDLIRRTVFSYVPGRAQTQTLEHESILELIEQHADPDAIEAAGRSHKLGWLDALEKNRSANGTLRPGGEFAAQQA